jgi:hypothetical protein
LSSVRPVLKQGIKEDRTIHHNTYLASNRTSFSGLRALMPLPNNYHEIPDLSISNN